MDCPVRVVGWHGILGGSILLTRRDDKGAGQLGLLTLGLPARKLVDLDGVLLTVS